MSVEWFVRDASGRHGPLDESALKERLSRYVSFDDVSVWREGLQEWKTVREALRTEEFVAGSPRRAMGRWTLYGAMLGIAICAADLLFAWRGRMFVAWQGDGVAQNLGYIVGTVGLPAFAFFLAGAIRDEMFPARVKRLGVKAPATGVTSSGTTSPGTTSPGMTSPGADIPGTGISGTGMSGVGMSGNERPGTTRAAVPPPIPPRVQWAQASGNFITRNWRGGYPLWVSFWGGGVGGNFAAALISFGVGKALTPTSGFNPVAIFAAIVSVWLVIVSMSVWQWVGVWRSAGSYRAERMLAGHKAPWAVVARIMVILGVLQVTHVIVTFGIPQAVEGGRMAFLNDPDIPDYSIRVMRNGTEAEITGGIKYGLVKDFRKILRASRQIRVVHLNSIGGRIGEGEALYQLIKHNRLITYVSGNCMSACTVAFSGGAERVLREGAVLGFHRASFAGSDEKDSPELQGQRKVFSAAGYSPDFISRALATPSADIWKPSPEELMRAGVVSRISDGSDFAFSGLAADESRESLARGLTRNGGLYAVIQQRFPDAFGEMVDGYYNGYLNGDTEVEMTAALRGKLSALFIRLKPLADDNVLIAYGSLTADQLGALGRQSASRCYDFAVTGVLDDSGHAITPDMELRERDLAERVVRTAVERPGAKQPDKALRAKLFDRLAARGVTHADLDLIASTTVPEAKKARYCRAMELLYREIVALPPAEGAIMLRWIAADR